MSVYLIIYIESCNATAAISMFVLFCLIVGPFIYIVHNKAHLKIAGSCGACTIVTD